MNFGKQCENHAADYAKRILEWDVLARNVHSRFGELDLICHDGEQLRFLEVKGRRNDRFGSGLELVSQEKLRRLKKCISLWLRTEGWELWTLELWVFKTGPSLTRYELVCCH